MTRETEKLVETLERVAAKSVECVKAGVMLGLIPRTVLETAQADATLLLAHATALREGQ